MSLLAPRSARCRLTPRWSGRVEDKVPSSNRSARAAQLKRSTCTRTSSIRRERSRIRAIRCGGSGIRLLLVKARRVKILLRLARSNTTCGSRVSTLTWRAILTTTTLEITIRRAADTSNPIQSGSDQEAFQPMRMLVETRLMHRIR